MANNFIGYRKQSNKKAMEKFTKVKSLSTLKSDLQKLFNTFIRVRDTKHSNGQAFFLCISCGEPKGLDQMNAGHLYPVGSNEAIRFDEDNAWGQCIACNMHKHGNQLAYYKNLVTKIGQQRVDRLDFKRNSLSKLARHEVEYLIAEYKSKIEALKK